MIIQNVKYTSVCGWVNNHFRLYTDFPDLTEIATKDVIQDNEKLNEESLHPIALGIVVDNLSRFMLHGGSFGKAYKRPWEVLIRNIEDPKYNQRDITILKLEPQFMKTHGYRLAQEYKYYYSQSKIRLKEELFEDDKFISFCIELVDIQQFFKTRHLFWDGVHPTKFNKNDIDNVRILVNRILNFLPSDRTIYSNGMLEKATENVKIGDYDFIFDDTLIDLKISKYETPHIFDWIQLIVYKLLLNKDIRKLQIFNPKLNLVHTLLVSEIPEKAIEYIRQQLGEEISTNKRTFNFYGQTHIPTIKV